MKSREPELELEPIEGLIQDVLGATSASVGVTKLIEGIHDRLEEIYILGEKDDIDDFCKELEASLPQIVQAVVSLCAARPDS